MGSSWLAGELWERLGIAAGILKVATDRRVDAELVERVIFSMVANRLSVKPLSKLAGCTWVRQRAFIEGLTDVSDDACYPAMDVLIGGIAQLHKTGFFSVANLLNLEVDLLFFDTTSTYWETDRLEEDLEHGADDNDESLPHAALHERGTRVYNSASKDHRPDLPQVVLGMAATRGGTPVRVWTFGGAESDQVIIKKVEDDLGSWNLSRVIWVLDRGFTSAENQRAEYYGALSTKPTYKRSLRRTASGKPRIDRAAVAREAKLDGKFLLRTSDESLSAEDIALGYKARYEAERGWRDIKSTIEPAAGLSPPRRPYPRSRPAVLAGADRPTRCSGRSRRHLAQHPKRARPHPPSHFRQLAGHAVPAQRAHPTPARDPLCPQALRATPVLRLHARFRAARRTRSASHPVVTRAYDN